MSLVASLLVATDDASLMYGIERVLLKVELVAYAITGGIESVSHSSKGEINVCAQETADQDCVAANGAVAG